MKPRPAPPAPSARIDDTRDDPPTGETFAAEDVQQPRAESAFAFRSFLASVLVAVVPVVVATARAIGRGWVPLGDDALFAIRSFDVFGHSIPLLGTWTSASSSYGTNLNNPGPLLFDWLAAPAHLLGSSTGTAVGVMLLNVGSLVGIAVFAHRRGGSLFGMVAMLVSAALCWAMGSESLFEPQQPLSLLFPFLLFVILVWSTTCGDLVALPLAAGVGSLVVQTYLPYSLLVPALGLWALVGLVLTLNRQRRHDRDAWPGLRRRALRTGAVTGVVVVVAWAQPLIQQFTSSSQGNLTLLARGATSGHGKTIGYRVGMQFFASVVSLPPWWFRPSFSKTFFPLSGWRPPSMASAAVSLGALTALLGWCAWDARHRQDRASSRAILTAGVALAAGLVTVAQVGRQPTAAIAIFIPHELRFLWPIGVFVLLAIAVTFVRRFQRADGPPVLVVGVVGLAAVVFASLSMPTANVAPDAPNSQEWAIPAERQLARDLGSLKGQGPLLVDDLFQHAFADPYGPAVLAELQRRDVPFVVQDATLVSQLGPERRFTGQNAKASLLLRTGDAALTTPPGARRVALNQGLGARERRELSVLIQQIGEYIHRVGIHLDARGADALRRGALPGVTHQAGGLGPGLDPEPLFVSRDLLTLVRQHDLSLDGAWEQRFARYASLQDRSDRETVALFVAPRRREAGPVSQASRG